METYLKLMQNPVEMKDLFFEYLKSRMRHCRRNLLDACECNCEIKSTPDGLFWEDGHFGLHAYRSMVHMSSRCMGYDWEHIQEDSTYPMCLNQVVKEISRVNGPHNHFLAFFELYTCEMFNKSK